jgi:transposase
MRSRSWPPLATSPAFRGPCKLVGYSGLGAGVHASGQTYQTGRITKQGRCELRTTMIEAAWVAVEHHPYWKAQFERLTYSIGKRKAIVAIARKLLVAVWHVLTKHVADCHADPVQVAGTFIRWTLKYGGQAYVLPPTSLVKNTG